MTTRCTRLWFLLLFAGCAGVPGSSDRLVASELGAQSGRFLAMLSEQQLDVAQRSLDDDEAMLWHFVPGRYAGVELGVLDELQTAAAHDVLRQMLSARGFAKTMAVVELENVLHELESRPGRPAGHRDPGRYALLVCGEPATGNFVVRFQGHHVSLRMAVVDGMLVGHTPHFLGTNPHRLPGQSTWQPVLAKEEDLARQLLAAFDETQLDRVVFAKQAPPDVVLGPGKPPEALGERRGLPWSQMNDTQRGLLWQLLELYAHLHRRDVADGELARIRAHGLDELSFAWAGGVQKGEGHYYRIHGQHFVVEYDCTQNEANHVHTVWRDFDRDFGGDVLRQHLEHAHGK